MIDELTQVADRELHLVKGKIPAGQYIIPVFVDYYVSGKREYVKITPAVGLNSEQAGWLYYVFSVHNAWKRRDMFLVERHFLEQFTEKAPGITPEYYFRWPGAPCAISKGYKKLKIAEADKADDGLSEDTEEFIDFVRRRRSVDANVLRLAIDLIAREAAYWLTVKKKPIDLGFTKIFAVPYRINWKEILLARFRDIAWVFNSNKETKEEAMKQAGFREHLCTLELMAIDRQKRHITWSLEALPTKQFEKETAEIEMTKQAGGDTQYIRLYEKLVAALSPKIVEIFTSYVQKMARPFPEIRKGMGLGSQKMVPYSGPHKLLPAPGRNIPCYVSVDLGPRKVSKKERDAQLVVPAINGLPKMSTVPKKIADVRGCEQRGILDKPTDGQEGTSGVLVPDDNQSRPAELKLLSIRSKPGDESLAQGT